MLFTGGAMLSITALVALTGVVFNHTLKRLTDLQQVDTEVGFLLRDTMVWPFFMLVVGAFFMGLFCIYIGIKVSNRIYGPLIPINRHIQNLKDGHYGSRMVLRRHDELTEIRDGLNELAAILEARHPK